MGHTNRTNCRVCAHQLHPHPLLALTNMPGAAQFLPDARTVKRDRGVRLVVNQCSACGLIQLGGKPVPYWREVIRAVAFSDAMRQFRLRQLGDFINTHGLSGQKGVEIGSGRGEYLVLLRALGLNMHGVEHGADAVRDARRQGLSMQRGFVKDRGTRLKNAPFDAFFMLNTLEHLPKPHRALEGIARNLKPGAVGLVEVPHFDMILQEGLFSEFIADHLFYFTTATLTGLLEKSGFQVLACQPTWHGYILSATVRKRTPTDLTALHQQRTRMKETLHRFLDRFTPGRVAAWGAGHQALALLALLELGPRLRYVVDSAPFKQGKFTPATHRPIVDPEALRRDPVEAVIVMAAAYSDEVAQRLRQEFDPKMGVAIVRPDGLEILPHG